MRVLDIKRVLYPYDTMNADVAVALGELRVDGKASIATIDSEEHVVDFRVGGSSWKAATASLEVVVAPQALKDYEAAHDIQVSAVARVFCRSTNVRDVFPLERVDGGSHWRGDITLPSSAYFGSADLTVVFTAPVEDVSERIIATSDGWRLHFDESAPSIGTGRIKTKWRKFAESPEPFYSRRDYPYLLDASGNEPIIYLNKDFPDLPVLLADRRRRSPDAAALSEMTILVIAQGCWMALFNAAALAIQKPEQENHECEMPRGWQGELLGEILPKMYPNKPEGEALFDVYSNIRDAAGILQADVLAFTGDVINFANKLKKHIQRLSEGEGS